jgi:hypothetical protein
MLSTCYVVFWISKDSKTTNGRRWTAREEPSKLIFVSIVRVRDSPFLEEGASRPIIGEAALRESPAVPLICIAAAGKSMTPDRENLLAPTIHHRTRHCVTDCFVSHCPLELINPVVVLLVKFPLHGIRNFRSRHRTPDS